MCPGRFSENPLNTDTLACPLVSVLTGFHCISSGLLARLTTLIKNEYGSLGIKSSFFSGGQLGPILVF